MPRTNNDRRDQRQEVDQLQELFGGVQVASDEAAIVRCVIPLLVDLETRYTDREICERVQREFNIPFGVDDLLRLQKTVIFQELWPLSEFGIDPRVAVARHAFVDLLTVAMDQLQKLLVSIQTPASVKMRAIERVIEMNKVQNEQNRPSNSAELVGFLERLGAGGQINQLNIGTLIYQTLPQEYRDAALAVNSPTPNRNLLGIGSGARDAGIVLEGDVIDDDTPQGDE